MQERLLRTDHRARPHAPEPAGSPGYAQGAAERPHLQPRAGGRSPAAGGVAMRNAAFLSVVLLVACAGSPLRARSTCCAPSRPSGPARWRRRFASAWGASPWRRTWTSPGSWWRRRRARCSGAPASVGGAPGRRPAFVSAGRDVGSTGLPRERGAKPTSTTGTTGWTSTSTGFTAPWPARPCSMRAIGSPRDPGAGDVAEYRFTRSASSAPGGLPRPGRCRGRSGAPSWPRRWRPPSARSARRAPGPLATQECDRGRVPARRAELEPAREASQILRALPPGLRTGGKVLLAMTAPPIPTDPVRSAPLCVVGLLVIGGCAVGPDYQRAGGRHARCLAPGAGARPLGG